jgi:hypothetical protein
MAAKKHPIHQCVGSLVAPLAKVPPGWEAPQPPRDVLAPLMRALHDACGLSKRATTGGLWACADAPYALAPLCAHVCVVQLHCGSVCVLKLAEGGSCTIFVRMRRSHWEDWAKAKEWEVDSARAFRHPLSTDQGVHLLTGARVFCAPTGEQVHHPHALSVLCAMERFSSRIKKLSHPVTGALTLAHLSGREFELVALPPSPMVVEECFCLLGHKETFVRHKWKAMEDEDAPLSAHVVSDVWRGIAQERLCAPGNAKRFQDGAVYLECAKSLSPEHLNSTRLVTADAAYATLVNWCLEWKRAQAEASLANRESMLAPSEDEDEQASALAAAPPASASATKKPNGQAPAPEVVAQPPPPLPPAAAEALLLPPPPAIAPAQPPAAVAVAVAPAPQPPAPERARTPAKAPVPRRRRPAPQRKPQAKRARRDQAGESSDGEMESDESDDSSCESRTSDEESSASVVAGFDEESEEGGGEAGSPVPLTAGAAAAAPAAAPVAVSAGLSVDALLAMSRPCCAHVDRWMRTSTGDALGEQRTAQLKGDLHLLENATGVAPIVAAALSLVRTLVDVHADPLPTTTVHVSAAERQRVRALAARAVGFAEATLGDVDRAIAESRAQTERLEVVRKRGYDALEAAEAGGFAACALACAPALAPAL